MMKNWKWKILYPLIFLSLVFGVMYLLWNFPYSSGKRVGRLAKITKKGKIIKTWEGTLDEGSGDKLTSYFSIRNDEIGQELYDYAGRDIVVYYDEYLVNWPFDTKYSLTSWKPNEKVVDQQASTNSQNSIENSHVHFVGKTLFCSMLGSLYKNKDLYEKVKNYLKEENPYIYNQYVKCNE